MNKTWHQGLACMFFIILFKKKKNKNENFNDSSESQARACLFTEKKGEAMEFWIPCTCWCIISGGGAWFESCDLSNHSVTSQMGPQSDGPNCY